MNTHHNITEQVVYELKLLLIGIQKTLQHQIRSINLKNNSNFIGATVQEAIDQKNGRILELQEELKEYESYYEKQINNLKKQNFDLGEEICKTNQKVQQQEQMIKTMKVDLMEMEDFMSNVVREAERAKKRNGTQEENQKERKQRVPEIKTESEQRQKRIERLCHDRKKEEDGENSEVKCPSIFGINPNSGYIHKFKINDGIIELKQGRDGLFYQLLTNTSIKKKPVSNITLLATAQSWIYFGIVSDEYIHDQFSFWEREFCIFYLAYNGDVFVGKKNTGNRRRKGAIQGQTITMTVSGEKIVWGVGTKTIAQLTQPIIKNNAINWVPFIAMTQRGDRIQIQ